MCEIPFVVNGHDIIELTDALYDAFDIGIDTYEVFTGKEQLFLKGYRGLAFIVRKSLKYQFTETDLVLWLKVQLDAIDYSFGLNYVPGECSRHWDVENFEKTQNDVFFVF